MLISGEDLKRMRLKQKLTQAELAKASSVSQSLIARIEKGSVDPRLSTLRKITSVLEGKREMHASDVMSKPVISITPNETVAKAITEMERFNISQMPVMERGKQVGSISDSIIMKKMTDNNPSELGKKSVRDIMDNPFPEIGREDSIKYVYNLLRKSPAVLVVDRNIVCGIISKADVMRLIL